MSTCWFRRVSRAIAILLAMSPFAAPYAAEPALTTETGPQALSIRSGDKLVLRYRYGDVAYKPYVEQFCTPSAVNPIRDAPADHLHHHGLMFAVTVDGVNFWEEQAAPGKEQHLDFSNVKTTNIANGESAGFTERLNWVAPEGDKTLLAETRTIEVYKAPGLAASLLTWKSLFTLPQGKASAKVTGTKYHGLGIRFLQSMDTGGSFLNADGGTAVAGTNLVKSKWCAYSASADGKPVTIALFDHPSNPRHPAVWYTMDTPFAYISATLGYDKEPVDVSANLSLCYGVALWDGAVDAKQIEEVYGRWKTLVEHSVDAK